MAVATTCSVLILPLSSLKHAIGFVSIPFSTRLLSMHPEYVSFDMTARIALQEVERDFAAVLGSQSGEALNDGLTAMRAKYGLPGQGLYVLPASVIEDEMRERDRNSMGYGGGGEWESILLEAKRYDHSIVHVCIRYLFSLFMKKEKEEGTISISLCL